MISYNYTLSSDFINGVNPTCLDRTITSHELDIQLIAVNVEWATGDVNVFFENELSIDDKAVLDSIISVHNPVLTCDVEINATTSVNGGVNFAMSDHSKNDYVGTGEEMWTPIRSFVFSGTASWVPTKFLVIGSMEKDGETASARLFDYTNGNEIAVVEWSDSNKVFTINDSLTNIPESLAIFELQVKTSKKGTDARTHYMALY